jgi:glycosyltransferase involved in cell wall biosynthesis
VCIIRSVVIVLNKKNRAKRSTSMAIPDSMKPKKRSRLSLLLLAAVAVGLCRLSIGGAPPDTDGAPVYPPARRLVCAADATGRWHAPPIASASGTWVWVQCGGDDENFDATPLAHLAAAAQRLDLNVLLCEPPAAAVPTQQLDRFVVMPPRARCPFYGGRATDARRYLQQIAAVLGNVTAIERVLMVTRVVEMGGSAAAVAATLREMLRHSSAKFAATPRLVHGPADVLFAHGRDIGEVAGGRFTLTTRLAGAAADYGPARVATAVASGSGVLLVSRDMLQPAVAAALARCDRASAAWRVPPRTALVAHAVMDLAIAALRLPAVRAVPVTMRIAASRWRGWPAYQALATDMSRGGPDYDNTQPQTILTGIGALLPAAMVHDATRRRDARRGNTAAEQRVADGVTLFWEIPQVVMCNGCNGFTVEATNSMLAVEPRLQTRAVVWTHCWCAGLPPHHMQTLARLVQPKGGSGDEVFGDRPAAPRRRGIWVTHAPLQISAGFPYKGYSTYKARPYIVSRCMLEVDRVSPQWVDRVNNGAVDEVWVPAAYLRDAFYKSGVHPSKRVFVVPDGIDVHAYDPAIVEPSKRIAGDARYKGHYKFFSNFKLDYPKGFDVLFTAYFTAFRRTDRVVLYVKTFLWFLWRTGRNAHFHDSAFGRRLVLEWAAATLNRTEASLPAFEIIADAMPTDQLQGLYRAVDCFVLPTRGEGWGLPFHEAMAMGLPAIGTNWGGNIQFMNATNSLLIDVAGYDDPDRTSDLVQNLIPANRSSFLGDLDDPAPRTRAFRAQPSLKHTGQQMRWAFENPEKARAIGAIAREHVVRYFSLEAHAQHVMDRVVAINERLDRASIEGVH